ncbi:outer membrane beta-barrel protein [Hymenobacter terrenus]|uniref:outer membrane beta-barrel protein n=1 Tax=Hymenobacter terrenus TaxID=1629124 RepID=UPI000AA6ED60|nr:hypothetical protein [Hymenobacter terrenus]
MGYFFADNLAIGLQLSYAATKSSVKFTGPGTSSPNSLDAATQYRIGPYLQYYKMLSEQFGILGTLGAGYQNTFTPSYASNLNNNIIETKGNGFYAGITPGVIFFPVPKFGISASIGSLGYDQLNQERNNDPDGTERKVSNFGARFGLSELLFGGTYYFGR